jgi:hypothetical protein
VPTEQAKTHKTEVIAPKQKAPPKVDGYVKNRDRSTQAPLGNRIEAGVSVSAQVRGNIHMRATAWVDPRSTAGSGNNVGLEISVGGKRRSNDYRMEVTHGPPIAAGDRFDQARQAALTGAFSGMAVGSIMTTGRLPPDFVARNALMRLSPTPPNASQKVTKTGYTSRIPSSAEKAYESFVSDPVGAFGSAGLKLRPAPDRLTSGARFFIEDRGPPPAWAPCQANVDAVNRTVMIATLDGHPIRGTNHFQCTDDGKGGCVLTQHSEFQGSSPLVEIGKKMGAIDRQHQIWENLHRHVFDVNE